MPQQAPPAFDGLDMNKPEDVAIASIMQRVQANQKLTEQLLRILQVNPGNNTEAAAGQEGADGDAAMNNGEAEEKADSPKATGVFLDDLKAFFEQELESEHIAKDDYDRSVDFLENKLKQDPEAFSKFMQFMSNALARQAANEAQNQAPADASGQPGNMAPPQNTNDANMGNWGAQQPTGPQFAGYPNNPNYPNMGGYTGYPGYPGYSGYSGYPPQPYPATFEVGASNGMYHRDPAPGTMPFNPMGPVGHVSQTEMLNQRMGNVAGLMGQVPGFGQPNSFKMDPAGIRHQQHVPGTTQMSPEFASKSMYDPLKTAYPGQQQQAQPPPQRAPQQPQWPNMYPQGYAPMAQPVPPQFPGAYPFMPQQYPTAYPPMPNQYPGMQPPAPGYPGYPQQPPHWQNQGVGNNSGIRSVYTDAAGKLRDAVTHQFVSEDAARAASSGAQSRRFDAGVANDLSGGRHAAPVAKRTKDGNGGYTSNGRFASNVRLPTVTNVLASNKKYVGDDDNRRLFLKDLDNEMQDYLTKNEEGLQMMRERFGANPDAKYVHKSMRETSDKQIGMFDRITANLNDPARGWNYYAHKLLQKKNMVDKFDLREGEKRMFAEQLLNPAKGSTIVDVRASRGLFGKVLSATVGDDR